jgi:diguanylate cyclase (GGDEF)-like protein/PAS domain S-box-containing protein
VYIWWRRRQRHEQRLLKAHRNVVVSEERLRLALVGSGSGVWDWQAEHNVMFENRVNGLLGHSNLPKLLSFVQHVDLVHPNDRCDFESAWAMFLANPAKNFECTYRMKTQDGQWFWFHDLGMVAEKNGQGKPIRITGTYTNITDTKANEEQAKLFGEAFRQTRDWVLILDVYQEPIAANHSFRETFGLQDDDAIAKNAGDVIGIDRNKQRAYTEILNHLEAGSHWQGEEMVVSADGQVHPVILSIDAVAGKADEVAFFVLVMTDITAQKAAENDLRQLANYDSLTGLPNRALLLDRIKHAIEHARRYTFNMALFFIDLDRFKQVNDSLGHDVGDLLLIDVAKRLQSVLREGDTVARLGGDEFVILLESYHSIEDVSHIAQKVIDEIDQPITLGNDTVSISPSIGISLYPEDASQHNDLLKNADVAMYHAKEAGRCNYQYFTVKMNEQARVKLEQENNIKQAFLNNEFINYYQPIVDMDSNKIKGFELLMRWQSANGLIPPYKFIPVAEDIGLIVKMTQSVLKQGLIDLRVWHDMGYEPYLSVNLSIKDLEQDSLAEDIEVLILASGLPASSIRFEITESALMIDINKAIETMDKLTKLGTILALDDFGTGYSSLKYLKEFPIEIIKIDRSFVMDIGIDNNDEAIIDSIIVMANSLGMKCIAEGVETTEQLAFLTDRNCKLIQGYLFSKPVPLEDASALLSQTFDANGKVGD